MSDIAKTIVGKVVGKLNVVRRIGNSEPDRAYNLICKAQRELDELAISMLEKAGHKVKH